MDNAKLQIVICLAVYVILGLFLSVDENKKTKNNCNLQPYIMFAFAEIKVAAPCLIQAVQRTLQVAAELQLQIAVGEEMSLQPGGEMRSFASVYARFPCVVQIVEAIPLL